MFGIKKKDFVSFWGKGLMFETKKKDFCNFFGEWKGVWIKCVG